jgi:hypothetical protein
MLVGAVAGWLILSSTFRLLDTAHHRGPGYIDSEDGYEKVSEHQYKRYNYTMSMSIGKLIVVTM